MNKLRKKIKIIIFGTNTRAGKLFDEVLIVAIVLSIITVMLESVRDVNQNYGAILVIAEWLFTILFTFEYLLRLFCIKRPLSYAFSFFGIIDLLSVIPTYLSLLLPGTQVLSVIRVLRVLRIFRILKLVQYMGEANNLVKALISSKKKIFIFLFAVLNIVIILGSTMYLIEGEKAGFSSIPRSVYWAIVTLTTVGYGDIAPITSLGQTISAMIMLIGYSIIAVPTGIKFFNWVATLWGGRITLNSAILFSCGFIVNFVLGGITGVALAQVPFDIHVHDTYFVVAHFHYIVYGGSVFVIFSSIYHWYPKFTGKMLDEKLGIIHFVLTFIGFNLCFAPQHWLGLNGMPRRVAEYDPQFTLVNQISSVGALLMAISTLPFLWNILYSFIKGEKAGNNPWQALTPEWLTTSPPPVENWSGEAPLVTKPYGYGEKNSDEGSSPITQA